MNPETTTDIISNITTSSAIVIGGFWAYFKFARGRVFARRAELSVTPTLEKTQDITYISIAITLKNAGMSKLPLNEKMKAVRILGLTDSVATSSGTADWERILTLPILSDHAWLEAQETVTDTVLFRLNSGNSPGRSYTAYQVEAIVGAPRRFVSGKGVRWRSRSIVFPPAQSSTRASYKRRIATTYTSRTSGSSKRLAGRRNGSSK